MKIKTLQVKDNPHYANLLAETDQEGGADFARYLVENGYNVDGVGAMGPSPVDRAFERKNFDIGFIFLGRRCPGQAGTPHPSH